MKLKIKLLKAFNIELGHLAIANQYTPIPVSKDLMRINLPPRESNLKFQLLILFSNITTIHCQSEIYIYNELQHYEIEYIMQYEII